MIRDNGGVLAVDMSIIDVSDTLVNAWTLNTSDSISGIGGNRYGWFDFNQFSTLAIDNSELRTAPQHVPDAGSSALLLGFAFANVVGLSYFKQKK